jgi:hypothetical protein
MENCSCESKAGFQTLRAVAAANCIHSDYPGVIDGIARLSVSIGDGCRGEKTLAD